MIINTLHITLQNADEIIDKMTDILNSSKDYDINDLTLSDISSIKNTIMCLSEFVKQLELT